MKILKNLFDISKSRTVEIEAADRDFFNNLSGRQWLKRFRIGCACRFPARAIAAVSMEKGKLFRFCKPGVMARVINACATDINEFPEIHRIIQNPTVGGSQ